VAKFKINKIVLCLTEINNLIIVFQIYNTRGCPLKKTSKALWLSSSNSFRRIYSFAGVQPLKFLNNKIGHVLLK
jgi:hypothetical protein